MEANHPLDRLTSRECHVLRLVADGKTNKEIARELGLGVETVKGHLKSIFVKLEVVNRAQAAALWARSARDVDGDEETDGVR